MNQASPGNTQTRGYYALIHYLCELTQIKITLLQALWWFHYPTTSGYNNSWISLMRKQRFVGRGTGFINKSVSLHRRLRCRVMVSCSWVFRY